MLKLLIQKLPLLIYKILHKISKRALILQIDVTIFILKAFYKNHPPIFYFKMCWNFLSVNKLALALVSLMKNTYQLSHSENILILVIKRLRKSKIDYTPEVICNVDSLNEIIKLNTSGIILTVHSDFALVTRTIARSGRNVTTIVNDPKRVRNSVFNRSGINSYINLIKTDEYCLVKLLESVKKSDIICCDIDFQDKNKIFSYISPALFDFSKKFSVPLYFGQFQLSNDGVFLLSFKKASSSNNVNQNISEFIEYININRYPKKIISVKKYSQSLASDLKSL